MRVVCRYFWREMARNCHHGLVAGLGFGKLRNRVVAKVVETESISRALDLTDIGFALFVLASLAGILLQAALRTTGDTGSMLNRDTSGHNELKSSTATRSLGHRVSRWCHSSPVAWDFVEISQRESFLKQHILYHVLNRTRKPLCVPPKFCGSEKLEL